MQFTTRQNVNEKPACSISKLSVTVSLLAPLLQAAASSSKQRRRQQQQQQHNIQYQKSSLFLILEAGPCCHKKYLLLALPWGPKAHRCWTLPDLGAKDHRATTMLMMQN